MPAYPALALLENSPFLVLILSVAFIVLAITKLRFHAFVALTLAALLVGFLSAASLSEAASSIGDVMDGFGRTATGVGIVIALAAIIGMCLMDSGAADVIVRRFMKIFGEKRAAWALMVSGFVLSIPVFFDTVFFLLVPIARMLALRTGRNYMLYIMAMGGGGAITHSIVPPTPGPLLVGDMLRLDLGAIMIAGFVAGILPAIVAVQLGKWMDRKNPVPVRETSGASLAQLKKATERKDSELPSFALAILPVILPAILLATFSFIDMQEKQPIRQAVKQELTAAAAPASPTADAIRAELDKRFSDPTNFSALHGIFSVLGNKIIALGLGTLIAMFLLLRQSGLTLQALSEKCGPPLETAGVVILITCAGGSFGKMIQGTGIGEAIKASAENFGINYIILAWVVTAIIRIAQGSATVSMITGAGLMAAVIGDGSALSYHPLYIFLAIGFGSITCSWMNDSGFWIVGKLSGFTEKETLKSWTVLLTVIAVIGLIETLLFSVILPFKGGG